MKNHLLLLTLYCFPLIAKSQHAKSHNHLHGNLSPQKERHTSTYNPAKTIWTEQQEKRTAFSAVFNSNDGQIKAIYSKKAIHFEDENGKLIPINFGLQQKNDFTWSAEQQPFPTYFHQHEGAALTIEQDKRIWVGQRTRINLLETTSVANVKGNTVTAKLNENIVKTIDFSENKFKYAYELKQPLEEEGDMLHLDEQIKLPKGYTMQTLPSENAVYPNATIVIFDEKGIRCAQFREPLCFDADNHWMIAKYEILHEQNADFIRVSVPSSWLNSPERKYPVVIDPEVVGTLASYSGGTIPSCISPNFSSDSIQVTIPANITVTGIYVTSSFLAVSPVKKIDGSMKFSTSCDTSQTFSISPNSPNSPNLPGIAYLDSANILNPIMCCFPESCKETNFYLRMHISRNPSLGSGCNTNFIRYDPSTTYPFQAVVVGKTVESNLEKWKIVSKTPICSDQCKVQALTWAIYGVAPYTFSHPWSSKVITQGKNIGCGTGSESYQFDLTIPNCPTYCDPNTTSLVVPAPKIIDACGNAVTGIPTVTIPIKMTPKLSATYDPLICSGQNINIPLTSCAANGTISWEGNNKKGSDAINDVAYSYSSANDTINYFAIAANDGCTSDTFFVKLHFPPFQTDYSWSPQPVIAGKPSLFNGSTNPSLGNIVEWKWYQDKQVTSSMQAPEFTFENQGNYSICLEVKGLNGCTDSLCKTIQVIPSMIQAPNIITPNGDQINDFLAFNYLEFYPENHLVIVNRWGNTVYEADEYKNNWNGEQLAEGVYFYKLKINLLNQELSGFFHIKR